MDKQLPTLDELFPFEYVGGGHFRHKNVQIGEVAPILHGKQAVEYLYERIKESTNEENP